MTVPLAEADHAALFDRAHRHLFALEPFDLAPWAAGARGVTIVADDSWEEGAADLARAEAWAAERCDIHGLKLERAERVSGRLAWLVTSVSPEDGRTLCPGCGRPGCTWCGP